MQNVYRKQIMPKAELICVQTDKFKTGCLSVTLISRLSKKTASLNAVLPRVLRRGTSSYPDMESIASALDDLYGAHIEPFVRKKGENQLVGFISDFVDDYYIDGEDSILESVANLMGEMLLSPNTFSGRLRSEYVNSEREQLIDEINAAINDKIQYSVTRLVEQMCSQEAYGINKLGTAQTAAKISVATLTKQYRELLASSEIRFFYCGSADFERVELAVMSAFSALPRKMPPLDTGTDILLDPVKKNVRNFTDELDVTQGKLSIGFRLGETMAHPNYAAIMVFNALYGGSVNSKLFLNVREKLSLCYYASSMIEKHKGIMIVYSGIEFDKFETAKNEILAQLEAVKNGEFEKWELDSAKRSVINSLKTISDQMGRLEDFYLDYDLIGIPCTPEDLAAIAESVSEEEIIKIASCIKTDSVYFLKGADRNDG